MPSSFVWYELMTTDTKAAETFYRDTVGLGAKDASMPGMNYTLLTMGETHVAGVMDLPEDAKKMGTPPNWIPTEKLNSSRPRMASSLPSLVRSTAL